MTMACVVLDRISCGCFRAGSVCAEFAARVTMGQNSTVAVGDCAQYSRLARYGHHRGDSPRETDIARWKGGSARGQQTLAANVDLVIVVQYFWTVSYLIDRIVRSAVISKDCGAAPVPWCSLSQTLRDQSFWLKSFSITAALGSTVTAEKRTKTRCA